MVVVGANKKVLKMNKYLYTYHPFWQGIRRYICDDIIVSLIWKIKVFILHKPNCDFDWKVLIFLRKYFVGKLQYNINNILFIWLYNHK